MGHKVSKDGNTTEAEAEAQPEPDQLTGYKLTYLGAEDPVGDTSETAAEFITDIEEFRKQLPVMNVPRVELAQC